MPLPFGMDQLWSAWERVQENDGCAGTDGVTVAAFSHRAAKELEAITELIEHGEYRPFPLLRIVVEKKPGSGKMRMLMVPSVRDRIIETAVARYLSHSFEEEFLECSYGYRPGRGVDRAVARIRQCHEEGYTEAVDSDVEGFFDNVEHGALIHRLRERGFGSLLETLLEQWIAAEYWDGNRVRKLAKGIPQGSPISPLLANFFLEDFDRQLEESGQKLIRYADDFLILSKTKQDAEVTLLKVRALLKDLQLRLNEQKTRITSFDEGFRFLGVLFEKDGIWSPWKGDAKKHGRILYMARPMPAGLLDAYRHTRPPEGTIQRALRRAGALSMPGKPLTTPTNHEKENEMAFLYLTEQGSILRKAGDRLLVEKADEIVLDIPYHKLECVLLFGNVQVTTQAIAELLEKGIRLALLSRMGQYRGALEPPNAKNVERRLAQWERFRDPVAAFTLAAGVVHIKLQNSLSVLDSYARRGSAPANYQAKRNRLREASEKCWEAVDLNALNGTEGAAAKAYFETLFDFNKSEFTWPGRLKHPATDPLNALLSLTYTFILLEIRGLLEAIGLDAHLGFFHQLDYGRPSLAADLVEAFRAPVADRFVLWLVNKRMFNAGDFIQHEEGSPAVYLKPNEFTRYLTEYEKWMLRHAAGGPSFREMLRAEVTRLAKAIDEGYLFQPHTWRVEESEGSE